MVSSLELHGFARNRLWSVDNDSPPFPTNPTNKVFIHLIFKSTEDDLKTWPHRNVGEMRIETELLPQCWEQISHMYEEGRLLVAQSCGELAEFVRPEIRDSLILSIVQQLIKDSATVVREAAARNLALLLSLFPNMDRYIKVNISLTKYDSRGYHGEKNLSDLTEFPFPTMWVLWDWL
ncbi:hypothetical protein Lser_V15G29574 [Lactuca serriola]